MGYAVLGGVLLYAIVIAYVVLSDPLGLGGGSEGHFPNALNWVAPEPRMESYEWATAEALMRTGAQKEWAEHGNDVRVVDSQTESTGNLVVSVNPIDRFTWAAVARSSTGRCYAILLQGDRENPQFGQTYYAKLPAGTPCKADVATPKSVRGTEIPS